MRKTRGQGHKKKFYRSISFLLVICVIIILVPVNVLNIYSANRSQKIILGNMSEAIENLAVSGMRNLEYRIHSINNYCNDMKATTGLVYALATIAPEPAGSVKASESDESNSGLSDELISEINSGIDRQANSQLVTKMSYMASETRKHIANYEDADAFFIYYPEEGYGHVSTSIAVNSYAGDLQRYLLQEENLTIKNFWHIIDIDGVPWLIHMNEYKGFYYGGCINLQIFLDGIQEGLHYPSVEAVMNSESADEQDLGKIQVTRECGDRKLYLHISVDNSDVVENLPLIQRYNRGIAVFSLLGAPLLLILLQYMVIRPLRQVVYALNALKKDPDVRIEGKPVTREFDEIYQSFNSMAGEIVELKIDNYEQLLNKQKLELANLHLQMNPHFLMNTFNLVFHLAQMKEYQKIQLLVMYLSDYFRYVTLNSQELTPVAQEMELIRKYLEVAGIQYINKFEAAFDLDPALDEYRIPPLLIHNFVENFMKHGIVLKRVNHLKIQSRIDGGMAEFLIIDDGRGMSKEQAEQINAGSFIYKDKKNHLGLKNSWTRIHYMYEGKASMHIKSEIDQGVTVRIRLPLKQPGLDTGIA